MQKQSLPCRNQLISGAVVCGLHSKASGTSSHGQDMLMVPSAPAMGTGWRGCPQHLSHAVCLSLAVLLPFYGPEEQQGGNGHG